MLTAQKPMNRPVWWKGKFALFQMPQVRVWREGGRHLSKGRLPPPTNGNQWGESFYRQSGGWGATCRNSTIISNSHLQTGHQHHLGCFRSSASSVPGSSCPHFFGTNSQNSGRSCPGYSLILRQLTSPAGASISIKRLTGYGSEYYLQPLRKN